MSEDDPQAEQPIFIQPPLKARKGRGAVSNLQGRYEVLAREDMDDGWSHDGEADSEADSPTDTDVTAATIRQSRPCFQDTGH